MAYDFLSIPAISSECERVFSSCGLMTTPESSNLSGDMLAHQECLSNWSRRGAIKLERAWGAPPVHWYLILNTKKIALFWSVTYKWAKLSQSVSSIKASQSVKSLGFTDHWLTDLMGALTIIVSLSLAAPAIISLSSMVLTLFRFWMLVWLSIIK